MLVGRGIQLSSGGGGAVIGDAPRAVLAGQAGGSVAIWTMELSGTSLTARTVASGSAGFVRGTGWDGNYFYVMSSTTSVMRVQRSANGTTGWTHVISTTDDGANYIPTTFIADPNSDVRYIICDSVPANANMYYYKSTDGGATWSSLTSKAISSITDFRCVGGAAYIPSTQNFIVFAAHNSYGIHIEYDFATLTEQSRYPSSGQAANDVRTSAYFEANDLIVGCSNNASNFFRDFVSMPSDLSANATVRFAGGANQVGGVHYANHYNSGTRHWEVYMSSTTSQTLYRSDNGTTWTSDSSWSPAGQIKSPPLSSWYGAANGDNVIFFHRNNTTGSNPQVRVTWNGGTSFNTYSLPGTLTAKSDGIYAGVTG